MDALRNLELLITSRYPIIVIETYEEERVEQVLGRAAARLGLPLFVWTVSHGLRRVGALEGIYDTRDPLKALGNLAAMPSEGIFLFEDLHRSLGDPAVVRKLQDLARSFARERRAIVLAAPRVELPPELSTLATVFRLDLPAEEDLKALVQDVVRRLSATQKITLDLSPEDLDRLGEALKGLTLFEAERALTRAALDDMTLDRKDVDEIITVKKELLAKEGLLEFVPAEEGLGDVGGLAHLKAWLDKRARAFTAEAKQFGVPPPKGILLLGVQGCGKTFGGESRGEGLGASAAQARGRPALQQVRGGIGEEPRSRAGNRRADGALRADAGRDRKSPRLGHELGRGCRPVRPHLRPAVGVAPGPQGTRLRGRHLQSDRVAAAGAHAQGPLRRDLLYRSPDARGAARDLLRPPAPPQREPAAFDLEALAAASEGFSGAEIEQAVVSALYTAFSRGVTLGTEHILDELKETKPLSVTRAEEVTDLREWAQGRTVPAG